MCSRWIDELSWSSYIPPLTGSPLQFFVDYMNSGNVSAYGPGLIHGTVNKPAVFTVNTKDAGEGSSHLFSLIFPQTAKVLKSLKLRLDSTSLQVVCPWPLRVLPRPTLAAWTTRTGRARCPTCLSCLETTASWSNTTTSTFLEAPFLPGSLVRLSKISQPETRSLFSRFDTVV